MNFILIILLLLNPYSRGINIDQNLKWKTHIQTGDNSLVRSLTSRVNGIQKISTYSTPVRKLLNQCSWLSIKQLIFFHSVLAVHRTISTGMPLYLAQHLKTDHPLNTRQGAQGNVRLTGHYSDKVESSFLRRAAKCYNQIPADIKSAKTVPTFKKKLKQWTRSNIQIR